MSLHVQYNLPDDEHKMFETCRRQNINLKSAVGLLTLHNCITMHGTKNIKFVIASYSKLAQNTYKYRHNQVAKFFHQELANQFYLLEEPYSPYYKYKSQVFLENNYKLCWDRPLLTDKSVHFNGPDVITLMKQTRKLFSLE
jgi:hypothetical protein